MTRLIRLRTVWQGVDGAPYYTNLFAEEGSGTAEATAFQDNWADILDANSTIFVTALTATVEGTIAVIEDSTGLIVDEINIADRVVDMDGGGELLPRQTQGLISWRTGVFVNGRRLRGRTFLPGMQETLNAAGGVPDSALVATFQAIADGMLASEFYEMRIFSPTHLTSAIITQGVAWNQWATLRSRRD